MVFKEPKGSYYDSFLCTPCKSPSLIMTDLTSFVFLLYQSQTKEEDTLSTKINKAKPHKTWAHQQENTMLTDNPYAVLFSV